MTQDERNTITMGASMVVGAIGAFLFGPVAAIAGAVVGFIVSILLTRNQ